MPQTDLQIKSIQSCSWIFFFSEIDDPKIHMEMQGTKNSQNKLTKEE